MNQTSIEATWGSAIRRNAASESAYNMPGGIGTNNSRTGGNVIDLLDYREASSADASDGTTSPNEKRVAILNMMLDAAIAAARAPSSGDNIAFDASNINAVVSAIEGARRAVINALTTQRGDHE